MASILRLFSVLLILFTVPVAAGELGVREAWLRALPPGQPTTAIYLTLENAGPEPAILTGAEMDWAERAELHESRQVEGRWQMRHLSQLKVPAGESAVLRPGGVHLMVFGLRQSPRAGDTVALTLQFEGGQSLPVAARVVAPGESPPAAHH